MPAFYPTLARKFWQAHPAEISWQSQKMPRRNRIPGINPRTRSRKFHVFHRNVQNLAADTRAIIIPNRISGRYSYDNNNDKILYQPFPISKWLAIHGVEIFDLQLNCWHLALLHELVHWSGEKSRLNRDYGDHENQIGDAYMAEEINAELGALYLARILGLNQFPDKDRYENHPLGELKISAATYETSCDHAIQAGKFLMAFAEETRSVPDSQSEPRRIQ